MNRTVFKVLALLPFILSCKHSVDADPNYTDLPETRASNLKLDNVQVDSVILSPFNNSFDGDVFVYDKNLLFVDHRFCWVHILDVDGKVIGKKIGQGDKENEISAKKIEFYTSTPDGKHLFFGPSWDVFVFDSKFEKISEYRINWQPKGNLEKNETDPDPTDPIMYSVTYGLGRLNAGDHQVLLPIFSQFPGFDITKDRYSKEARIFAAMNIKNGVVEKIFGRLPPVYNQDKNTRTFSYGLYTLTSKNNIAVAFPADSNIYVLNDDFILERKFGVKGREMNTNYASTEDYDQMKTVWNREIIEKGNYNSLEFIGETDLLFRGYNKSGEALTDGLQVYNSDTLVADVNVPKGFKISGYIAPYYYSNAFISEKDQQIKVYRLKINL